jgi:archaeal flagellar protein FlaJ
MRRIYITLSKAFPQKTRRETKDMLRYAGMDVDAEVWLGESLALGFIVALVVFLVGRLGNQLFFAGLSIIAFVIYLVAAAYIPFFIAEKRAQTVEESLPSALQLMSSNIRAGMTPFQAMKISAREEFGLLKDEIDTATTKALGSESFSDALKNICTRVKLPALERSIKLFVRSIESGGHLARTLEESGRDISDNIMLRKELLANTRTYTVLILATVIIGAPVLFNISIHFTERLNTMRSSFNSETVTNMGMGLLVNETFTPDFLVSMSTVTILVTALIASLLVGVIVNGEEKYGLKYAFVIVPASIVVFYLIRLAVVRLLS